MLTYFFQLCLLGACVGHFATSVTFTVIAAFFLLVAVGTTVVAAETGVPVAIAETTVVAAETGVPVATAKTTIVAAKTTVVATAKTTVIVAEAAVAGIAPESFSGLPHSEGAAVRVAPGAVAVGAVAGAVAVAGTRLRPPSLTVQTSYVHAPLYRD